MNTKMVRICAILLVLCMTLTTLVPSGLVLRAKASSGPAPWSMFGHDLSHTRRSQFDTSNNTGKKEWSGPYYIGGPSSPAIGPDGTIYIGSMIHAVYATNPDGTTKWSFDPGNNYVFYSSPALGPDGTVYIGSEDWNLYALDTNGNLKWNFTTGDMVRSSPAIGPDGTIYFGSYDYKFYALNPDGSMKWSYKTGQTIESSPAIGPDGTIYVGSDDGNLYAFNPNGTLKWNFTAGSMVASSPALGPDGTIYVCAFMGELIALRANGTMKWSFKAQDTVKTSPALGADGTIYFGSRDRRFYAVSPTGTKKWEFSALDDIESSAALGADGTIYFGSNDMRLYALNPDGTERWDFLTGSMIGSSPAIGRDGTVYVASDVLYALGPTSYIKPPSAPLDLQATGGDASISLSWKAPISNGGSALLSYSIYRGTAPGCETFLGKVGNILGFSDMDVATGITYYYELTANNIGASSPRSNEANATAGSVPSAPLDLKALGEDALVELSWSLPMTDGGAAITNYTVFRGTDPGSDAPLARVGTAMKYKDSSVTNGQTYFYKVTARNIIGEGRSSSEVSATPMNYELSSSAWPMFRHDLNRTGRSQYSTSNNKGQEIWAFPTGYNEQSSPALGPDGTIYVGSDDSNFYAINPNGTLKWSLGIGHGHWIVSSPALGADGTIYVGSYDDMFYAIDPNGTVKWSFPTMGYVETSPALGPDGTVYFGSYDGYLYALHPDGTLKWKLDIGFHNWIVSSPALGPDGTIYIGSFNQLFYAINPDGTEKWSFRTGSAVHSSPALGPDGMIYFGSLDDKFYALYPNGTMKWSFKTGDRVYSSPALGSDGTIYFTSYDHKIYALNPDGTKKWDFTTGDQVGTNVAIGADGTVYFGSNDNKMYALNPDGSQKWAFDAGSQIWSSVAISPEGIIYFGTYDGKLHALGPVTHPAPPSAPQGLSAVSGQEWVDLGWAAPTYVGGSPVAHYNIYRGTASGAETFLATVGPALTYRDQEVKNGTVYYYEVSASNAAGEGPRSNEASPVLPPKGSPPVFVTVPHDMKTVQGELLMLKVQGADADTLLDKELVYSLVQAPKGMAIDARTGEIKWRPGSGDVGTHTIVVGLSDGSVNETTAFNVTVKAQPAPTVLRTALDPRVAMTWGLGLFMVVLGFAFLGGTEVGVFGMHAIFLGLYTRLKGDEILDNFTRGQLYGMILQSPGSSFSELMRYTKRSSGTTTYHLMALEREGMIKSVSRGAKKLFFPSNFVVSDEYFTLTDAQRVVYNVVKVNPGISQKGIAKRTGFKTSRINKIIHRLSEKGMLDVVKGKTTECYVQGDQYLKEKDLEPISNG